jgi:hypothetical protein
MITLTPNAVERSTYPISISFTDENGDPMTPNIGLNWTLTDAEGSVINSRNAVTITPDETVQIVLSGADLAIPDRGGRRRILTIEGTYDSSLGSGLPIKGQAKFEIEQLVAVRNPT